MAELLRKAIAAEPSLYSVAKATGVQISSLMRFMGGKTSLRLDIADRLAEYLGIECRLIGRRKD